MTTKIFFNESKNTSTSKDYEEYEDDIVQIAQEFELGRDSNGIRMLKIPDYILITGLMNRRDNKQLREMLIDSKMMPDSRFDQIADVIDELTQKIDYLEKEIKRFKSEKEIK